MSIVRWRHRTWTGSRGSCGRASNSSVVAGLDPAIHPVRRTLAKWMDTRAFASPKELRPRRRVKPAYDAVCVSRILRKFPDLNFKQPRLRVPAPPREFEL